jgi:signal transduction histidine kinase
LLEIGLSASNKINFSNFNVRECIEDVMKSFEGYPGSKEVILLLSSNKDLDITTEEKTFRSIMQNLIENSIKYRKRNINDAVTKISARRYKSGIKIKVKDNGQGMDKQVQSRAFDMFYRGNQGSEGSGLGLFIVKSNIERLGGEIKIKSRADHGTEMWVYLPTAKTN